MIKCFNLKDFQGQETGVTGVRCTCCGMEMFWPKGSQRVLEELRQFKQDHAACRSLASAQEHLAGIQALRMVQQADGRPADLAYAVAAAGRRLREGPRPSDPQRAKAATPWIH